jgi:hypothetical protein
MPGHKSTFAYRIDRWDADGVSVMEHVAGIADLPWLGGVSRDLQAVARGVHYAVPGRPRH